jgi:hypothetical protein
MAKLIAVDAPPADLGPRLTPVDRPPDDIDNLNFGGAESVSQGNWYDAPVNFLKRNPQLYDPRKMDWRGAGATAGSMLGMAASGGLTAAPSLLLGMSGLGAMGGDLAESGVRAAAGQDVTAQGAAKSAAMQGAVDLLSGGLASPGSPAMGLPQKAMDAIPYHLSGQAVQDKALQMPTQAGLRLEEMNRRKIPASPASINESSRLARWLENLADVSTSGTLWLQAQRNKVRQALMKDAENVVLSAPSLKKNADEVGQSIHDTLSKHLNWDKDGALSIRSENYDQGIYAAIGGKKNVATAPRVPLNGLRQQLHVFEGSESFFTDSTKNKQLTTFIEEFLGENGVKEMPLDSAIELHKRVYKLFGDSPNISGKLRDALDQDIANYAGDIGKPELYDAWMFARQEFGRVEETLVKNPLVKEIMGQGKKKIDVRAVVSSMFRANNIENTQNMLQYLDPKTVDDAKTRFIANFFDEGSPIGRNIIKTYGESSERFIDGTALRNALEANGSSLDAFFDAETVKALRALADMAERTGPDVVRGLKNATDFDRRAAGVAGRVGLAGSATWAASLPAVLSGEVGALSLAMLLRAPNSPLKTLLVKGMPTSGTAMRMGGIPLKTATGWGTDERGR